MTKSEIKKRFLFWQNRLGLSNWEIGIRFEKRLVAPNETKSFTGLACTVPNPEYKLALIRISLKKLKQVDDSTIIHELLHCLSSEVFGYMANNPQNEPNANGWTSYYQEQFISEIGRVILRVYNKK